MYGLEFVQDHLYTHLYTYTVHYLFKGEGIEFRVLVKLITSLLTLNLGNETSLLQHVGGQSE